MQVNNALIEAPPTHRCRSSLGKRLTGLIAVIGVGLLGLLSFASPAAAIGTSVPLGTTASFSVLAGQSVTNTGPSTLAGDIGVSPGTAISGFPPGIFDGALHSADAVALQAQSDLTVAYNNAAGQSPDASLPVDLGGLTLVAGVYNAASSMALTGALTLDGAGDPDSVFIFQIGSSLTTASASSVMLIGDAQPCNVFWQIGSSATLGTGSTFVGSILALTSINVTTGATVQGRALARNGSVTLDTNTFTIPACSAPSSTSTTSSAPVTTPPVTTAAATTTAPTATVAAPTKGDTAGGTVVTVTGSGFVPGQTTVTIGGVTIPASDVTVTDSSTLTFIAPAHARGTVLLTVTTPSGTSSGLSFVYGGPELAATGSSAVPPLAWAALLLIAGAGALYLTRRSITAQRRH